MDGKKRCSVSVPREVNEALSELRRTGRYRCGSYSEIIRQMVGHGLEVENGSASSGAERS